VLFGGQISVAAGIVATVITLLAGSVLGIIAGYYGGWVDELLMGVNELFLSLPWLYFCWECEPSCRFISARFARFSY
jgi:peptide/nickel transport system permease protein